MFPTDFFASAAAAPSSAIKQRYRKGPKIASVRNQQIFKSPDQMDSSAMHSPDSSMTGPYAAHHCNTIPKRSVHISAAAYIPSPIKDDEGTQGDDLERMDLGTSSSYQNIMDAIAISNAK